MSASCRNAASQIGSGAAADAAATAAEIVTSPNAIRTASVAAFFVIWEYYGRRMDPIFMAPRARSSKPRCN